MQGTASVTYSIYLSEERRGSGQNGTRPAGLQFRFSQNCHNHVMINIINKFFMLIISTTLFTGLVQAQDNGGTSDQDTSSEQAEAREDAYRKQMELEGSRDHDTFSNTTYSTQAKQEKIDKLPKESRENIRDQLTDIIIENGQWEPFDALREYPYEPSEAAQTDPGLREREEEAWDEQVEKYNQREANAYGASRPSMPDSNAQQDGENSGAKAQGAQSGGEQGEMEKSEGEGEQQGENQGKEGESQGEAGQEGSQGSTSAGSVSSYEPYQPQQNDDSDEISTAGVSESALDFLKARQQPGSSSSGPQASPEQAMEPSDALSQTAENAAKNSDASALQSSLDSQQQSASEVIIPGTIAIEDLDKLEGLTEPKENNSNPP